MWIIKSGIIFSILSIAIGAFGAHALANIIADKIEVFKTAVQYQIFHALGLILIGIIAKTFSVDLNIVAYLIICGIILFCHQKKIHWNLIFKSQQFFSKKNDYEKAIKHIALV